MAKVGFIGLGWMGLGMCKCMVRAGHEVMVYDVMDAPMEEMVLYSADYEGTVSKATDIKAVAKHSEYVCVVVRDEPQYRGVLTGSDGLIENMNKDSMAVIHGTLSPQFVREMAALGKESGVIVVDGPITGQKREEGQITVMIGASDADYERLEPILKPMGRILHTGDVGSGEVTKLVNNMMGSLNMLATTEALMYGVRAGVPIEILLDQASNPESAGNSHAVMHWDGLVEMKKIFRETGAGPAALTYKDLNIALQSAREFGLELPLTALGANSDVGKLPENYEG